MTEPLYSTSTAAQLLGVTPARVRALAQSRGLGRKPTGGVAWLFTTADIEDMRHKRQGGRPMKRPQQEVQP